MVNQSGAGTKDTLQELFGARKYVIGMVQLLALPGAPRWAGEMGQVLARAVSDAQALERGGVDGLIVENFGDAPFSRDRVEAHTVSAMTLAVWAVVDAVQIPVGVNVLRSDSISAMAIASTTGASFIRVNVHTGAMVTDQGIVEGRAHRTLRYRRELGADVKVLADVLVKHASPLGGLSVERAARDATYRGLADAIIVTGVGTGEPAELEDVIGASEAVPEYPVLVGSGVNEGNIAKLLAVADGVIVGTSLKEGGVVSNPVDETRVAKLAALVRELQ
jgi:membrane complex biogenesis BtpA family protein